MQNWLKLREQEKRKTPGEKTSDKSA